MFSRYEFKKASFRLVGNTAGYTLNFEGELFDKNLKRQSHFVSEDGWRFRLDGTEWDKIDDIDETLYRLKKGLQVYDITTGAIQFYQNAKQAADALGLDSKQVRELAFSRGLKTSKGRRFRLGTDLMEQWPSFT